MKKKKELSWWAHWIVNIVTAILLATLIVVSLGILLITINLVVTAYNYIV